MAGGLRLACALLLLLAGGCAHRAYYVFGPEGERSEGSGPIETDDPDPPPNMTVCQVDFRGVVLGEWTADQLRTWHWNTTRQRPCDDLELRFHRPGTSLTGGGITPAGTDILRQIAIDSNPERPHLTDAAVIRAVVSPRPAGGPGPDEGDDGKKTGGGSGGTEPTDPAPAEPEPVAGGDVDQPPPAPPAPSSGTAGEPRATGEKESTFNEMVGPALVGGGLVYALAFFQLLPLGGAAASPRPRPGRPAVDVQQPSEGGAAASAGAAEEPELRRDPRVRVRAAGFGEGPR